MFLFWGIKNIWKITVVLFVPAILISCSSSNFSYISRGELVNDPLYFTSKSDIKKKKNYGAIKFKVDETEDYEGNLFILQKNKKVYQAETMFKNKNNKKYFFSLGVDYKNKTPAIGLRIEF